MEMSPEQAEAITEDDEWLRKIRDWAHSHRTDTPLLSNEAVSRESIYRDRGL